LAERIISQYANTSLFFCGECGNHENTPKSADGDECHRWEKLHPERPDTTTKAPVGWERKVMRIQLSVYFDKMLAESSAVSFPASFA